MYLDKSDTQTSEGLSTVAKLGEVNAESESCIDSLNANSDNSSASSNENSDVDRAKINYLEKRKKTKQQRQQKVITLSFFYVGLVFIIVALPTSLFNACAFWYLLITDQVSEVLTVGFWVSQTFYGFVFLINPCLYASSNRYVRKTVRDVNQRLFGWCCCSRKNQGR